MSAGVLQRQAARWKRQADAGEMPEELFRVIAKGASGIEKRQVTNLARVSRIVASDGTIRPYDEFKHDWNYERSFYGTHDTCELCGKHPIVENCVLLDMEADKRIIIGNVCVYRYMEIEVDGITLKGEDKEKFLRENMNMAKAEHRRAQFASDWPTMLTDLKRYEDMMTSRYWSNGRQTPKSKEWESLHRCAVNRMAKHGYLGPKMVGRWEVFMENAEANLRAWNEEQEVLAEERRIRHEQDQQRRKELAQELTRKRNEWNALADEWNEKAQGVERGFNDWERRMVPKVVHRIRYTGPASLRGGYLTFHDEVVAKTSLQSGSSDSSNPQVNELQEWSQEAGFLNAWEASFIESVTVRLMCGRVLSEKQEEIVQRIRAKWKRRVTPA